MVEFFHRTEFMVDVIPNPITNSIDGQITVRPYQIISRPIWEHLYENRYLDLVEITCRRPYDSEFNSIKGGSISEPFFMPLLTSWGFI